MKTKKELYDYLHNRNAGVRERNMIKYGWDSVFNELRKILLLEDLNGFDLKEIKILDVGCAKYCYTLTFTKFAEVICIDISVKPITLKAWCLLNFPAPPSILI